MDDSEWRGLRDLVDRHKKDRDEALKVADTLRGRLSAMTDQGTHHDRVEHELISRLEAAHREVDRVKDVRDEERRCLEKAWSDLSAMTNSMVAASKDRDAARAAFSKASNELIEVHLRLREHEAMPLVRRVWPESVLQGWAARFLVEARAVVGVPASFDFWLGFFLVFGLAAVSLGVLLGDALLRARLGW